MRQQARVALGLMTTELRLAGYRIDNIVEAIDLAETNSIRFVGDIDDGDIAVPCDATYENATDGGAERVTYELSSGQLLRTVQCWDGSSWTTEFNQQVVAENLAGAQALFTYFDEAGNQLVPAATALSAAQRAQVRLVALDLSLVDPDEPIETGSAHVRFDISGRVRLPNVN
jgi:Tfp pilus assembly protein PilW